MKKILPILLLVVACGEKDDPQPSRTELLTAKQWTLVSIDGAPTTREETYHFKTDGTVTVTITGTVTGEWSFLQNDTVILIEFINTEPYEYEIVKLTDEELIFVDEQGDENLFRPL